MIESQPGLRSPTCQVHAVLVRVFETGVLIIGESGIGKSECALDLVTRGHQLAADDAVAIFVEQNAISGRAPELTRRLLEIRGLGIIDVPEIFGEDAVCGETPIDLCVELRRSVDATPLESAVSEHDIAGCTLPKYILPVSPGRNLAILVETAVRLFRHAGSDATSNILIAEHARLLSSS